MLPGNERQQAVLQTILAAYADDPRVLAVLVFGSLTRGNWDQYSDLDLDIVLRDDIIPDAAAELTRLCARIGLDALIVPAGDEGDVVLTNLIEFSIRYHHLSTTKPAILDSMRLLSGSLTLDDIRRAGEANRTPTHPDPALLVSRCVRYALEIHNAIRRGRLWTALELLQITRYVLMELFTVTRGGIRPVSIFEAHAAPELQARLAALVPTMDVGALTEAHHQLMGLLEHDLDAFSAGQVGLLDIHRTILDELKKAQ